MGGIGEESLHCFLKDNKIVELFARFSLRHRSSVVSAVFDRSLIARKKRVRN